MQKNKHFLEKTISHLLGLGLVILLAACDLPASPKTSSWDAEDYFKGKAVELADAAMQGDAEAIKRLMKEEGVNPDKINGLDELMQEAVTGKFLTAPLTKAQIDELFQLIPR